MLRTPSALSWSSSSSRMMRRQSLNDDYSVTSLRCYNSTTRSLRIMPPRAPPMLLSCYLRTSNHGTSSFAVASSSRNYLPRILLCLRTAATNSAVTAASTTSKTTASTSHTWWRRFAWFVKYTRIPILIIGIYGLGYQQVSLTL
jgi:hypothetical protein